MKHVKEFERRNFRDYRKYDDFLSNKFYHIFGGGAHALKIFEETGKIYIHFQIRGFDSEEMLIFQQQLKGSDFRFSTGQYMMIVDITASKEFMEEIKFEMEVNKYNL